MKTKNMIFTMLLGLLLFPGFAFTQPRLEDFLERLSPRIRAENLKVLQLEMSPDPVRAGQGVTFTATISNQSRNSGRVSLFIKDRDEIVAETFDVMLQPGRNRVVFPQTNYRFQRSDYCFVVEVDIERNRRPIDVAKEFCARRTQQGWTLSEVRVGPLYAENLEMYPDPVKPGQEVQFSLRIRNEGSPVRAVIRIQDKDEMVAQLEDIFLPRGISEFEFPRTRYRFERFDHCFTVIVDVDRTPYQVDSVREFCARPLGWSLMP